MVGQQLHLESNKRETSEYKKQKLSIYLSQSVKENVY